jgi:hypothetical protein
MTKKTFTSKPPQYQENPSEPDTSLPPPPYTPQETTPLIPGGPSYAGSSYAPSGPSYPSYTGPSYTASSRISDNSSTAGSLPSHFPRRNRTLRHAFRELRRDYLLATYHRALDAVAARDGVHLLSVGLGPLALSVLLSVGMRLMVGGGGNELGCG